MRHERTGTPLCLDRGRVDGGAGQHGSLTADTADEIQRFRRRSSGIRGAQPATASVWCLRCSEEVLVGRTEDEGIRMSSERSPR